MRQSEITELLKDMSLEEKIGQLLQLTSDYYNDESILTGPENTEGYSPKNIIYAGSVLGSAGAKKLKRIQKEYIARHPHKIPLLFMADVINGFRTVFPIPLAQGCTFDPELVRQAASVAAKEASAAGLHVTFSPMVDLVRDPRWGRVMESPGEDTHLNSEMARAMVEGYQGSGETVGTEKIGACVKHVAGYGAPVGGRDYNNAELSERTLMEDYMPAYKAAVDAGCTAAMAAFNTVDRIPATGNRKLLREILRRDWGFDGVLVSDWGAVEELINHGVAEDRAQAAELAIKAGVDIDMMTTCYCKNLKRLVEAGTIDVSLIDEACLRILTLKNKLGLFENPYKDADEIREQTEILTEESRTLARKAACESMVLLKNEDDILPLQKDGKTIAFIGPHVENPYIYGIWSIFAREEDTVTIAEGIRAQAGGCTTLFARGCELRSEEAEESLLQEAVTAAAQADTVVLFLGEDRLQSGEATSRGYLELDGAQRALFDRVAAVNENIVFVLLSGRPLIIREQAERAKAVLQAWMPGTEGGNAVADILFGAESPSGKLAMSFPYCMGQIPVTYKEFSTGRPYRPTNNKFTTKYIDIPNMPLYPFGFGLSYTAFQISGITLDSAVLRPGGRIQASVTVKNTGGRTGTEVVQLYIQDRKASVARPLRELKDFTRVTLAPGEERQVNFQIKEEMLRFYNLEMNFTSEPGEFYLYIGNSSDAVECAAFRLEA